MDSFIGVMNACTGGIIRAGGYYQIPSAVLHGHQPEERQAISDPPAVTFNTRPRYSSDATSSLTSMFTLSTSIRLFWSTAASDYTFLTSPDFSPWISVVFGAAFLLNAVVKSGDLSHASVPKHITSEIPGLQTTLLWKSCCLCFGLRSALCFSVDEGKRRLKVHIRLRIGS